MCVCKPNKKILAKFWPRHVATWVAYRAALDSERQKIRLESQQLAASASLDSEHEQGQPIEEIEPIQSAQAEFGEVYLFMLLCDLT